MKVAVWEVRYVDMKRNAKQRIAKAEREGLCVACMEPLGDGVVKRGCHEKCYAATRRAIKRGVWTLSDRLAEGKLLEYSTPGRKPTNPVSIEAANG